VDVADTVLYGLITTIWAGLLIFFYRRRIWLPYYATGAVGLALLIIFSGTRLFPLDRWLETATAYGAYGLCSLLGIPTRVFEAAPGNILVWVVAQSPGWTVVRVDLECSGLLELAVLAGLLLFYPAWPPYKRLGWLLAAWAATFAANVARVLSIILILHIWGKPSIFIAHTIAGRLVFFMLVAAIYWFVLTLPTLRVIQRQLSQKMGV
jgi:exosortase family protein XrtG